jgi:tetratricopeptide (TPR) repeat protein
VIRLFLILNEIILFSLFIISCYTYRPIRIASVHTFRADGREGDFPSGRVSDKGDDEASPITGRIHVYKPVMEGKERDIANGRPKLSRERKYRFFLKKFFAISHTLSQLDRINNKGVEYCLKGRFREAAILFKEVLKEDEDFSAALNNLGIIYELFGNDSDAFTMYSRACLLEPGNEYFRKNFLYFERSHNVKSP